MAKLDVGLYVVMMILALGFIVSLWQTLANPTQINIAITLITFTVTALLVAYATHKGKK